MERMDFSKKILPKKEESLHSKKRILQKLSKTKSLGKNL